MNFIICTIHKILLEKSSQEDEMDGAGTYHRRNGCKQNFGR